jgi:hypothetical protein
MSDFSFFSLSEMLTDDERYNWHQLLVARKGELAGLRLRKVLEPL